jgi:beta-glucanase (GH16 family)
MKKTILTILIMFTLVGCGSLTTPVTLTTTTAEVIPNGLEPLVAVSDCEVPTLEGGWTCIWADEFSGTVVDETKWNFEINGDGGGNNELQYYRKENATLADGILSITAKKESYLGKLYTSSRLTTKYKGTFEYVRIVVRAQMPSGRGTWPAIWMMPLMSSYGGWPDSGEIDIMEYVGYDQNRIYSTIHTELFNGRLGTQIGASALFENVETQFHDYELIWSPGKILTYVDGAKLGEFNYVPALTKNAAYYQAFPFDQPFFLILNQAVGGAWGGSQGVDPDIYPTALKIDFVRVYKLDYATIDKTAPSAPDDLQPATLANTLFWTKSSDDFGVERYIIYVNGVFNKFSNLNQVTLTALNDHETYQIQIQAVDFVGRTSAFSPMLSYTSHP